MGISQPSSSPTSKKAMVAAITGMLLLLFVIGHMLGNFQFFWGAEALNAYAGKLKSIPAVLWTIRIGFLAIFCLHIQTATKLAAEDENAGPISLQAISGVLIFIYVLYHLSHFTLGWVHAEHFNHPDAYGTHDVYWMVTNSFQNPVVFGVYTSALLVLCFHLQKATSSLAQNLGITDNSRLKQFQIGGIILAALLFAGYVSIPFVNFVGTGQ